MSGHGKRILIVGGVAGGASCAARARRLCEHSEIIMFCVVGQRSYYAARLLMQHGFRIKELSGGMQT